MAEHTEWLFCVFMLHWLIVLHECSEDQSNASSWMTNLPLLLQTVPLTYLAIPGSHDSGSYSLLSNDTENMINDDKIALNSSKQPLLGDMIYRWSKTQDLNITEQLDHGIRYLDLRIAVDKKGNFRVVHRLYGASLEIILHEVRQFIDKHTKEIILLDFNHVYGRKHNKPEVQRHIFNTVLKIFESKLCPSKLSKKSLSDIWRAKCQIFFFAPGWLKQNLEAKQFICIINSPFNYKYFTQKSTWLRYLDSNYKHEQVSHRPWRSFAVTQGIMQPHWIEIAIAGISSEATLKNWISDDATLEIVNWLKSKRSGPHGVNIVIADFVEEHDFVDTVLALNNNISRSRNLTSNFILLLMLFCVTITVWWKPLFRDII